MHVERWRLTDDDHPHPAAVHTFAVRLGVLFGRLVITFVLGGFVSGFFLGWLVLCLVFSGLIISSRLGGSWIG